MPIAPALHVHGPLALHAGMPARTISLISIHKRRAQQHNIQAMQWREYRMLL